MGDFGLFDGKRKKGFLVKGNDHFSLSPCVMAVATFAIPNDATTRSSSHAVDI